MATRRVRLERAMETMRDIAMERTLAGDTDQARGWAVSYAAARDDLLTWPEQEALAWAAVGWSASVRRRLDRHD